MNKVLSVLLIVYLTYILLAPIFIISKVLYGGMEYNWIEKTNVIVYTLQVLVLTISEIIINIYKYVKKEK